MILLIICKVEFVLVSLGMMQYNEDSNISMDKFNLFNVQNVLSLEEEWSLNLRHVEHIFLFLHRKQRERDDRTPER